MSRENINKNTASNHEHIIFFRIEYNDKIFAFSFDEIKELLLSEDTNKHDFFDVASSAPSFSSPDDVAFALSANGATVIVDEVRIDAESGAIYIPCNMLSGSGVSVGTPTSKPCIDEDNIILRCFDVSKSTELIKAILLLPRGYSVQSSVF